MTKEQIKALREDLGLTQLEFANKLFTTPTTVCRWEKGNTKPNKFFNNAMLQFKTNK